MRKPIFQAWGTLVTGGASAVGTSLDILGLTGNAPLIVKWLPLIMLLLFFGFVWWHWRDQNLRIQELEDKRPSVIVRPIAEGKYAYLEVHNDGQNQAKFEVKVLSWEGLESINHKMEYFYNARWELFDLNDPTGINSELKAKGGNNRVILAEVGGLASFPEDAIQYWNVSIPCNRALSFWAAKARIDTVVRITIQVLSEPPLKTPFKQTYALSINENGELQIAEA